VVEQLPQHTPVAGVYRDDITRLNQALTGLSYPAQKWQLIAHVAQRPSDPTQADLRTIQLLWALPADRYTNLAQVLAGAARTARGHPRRGGVPSSPAQHAPL